MGTSQKSTAVTPILPQLVAQGRMSALETESARLLAPEDDAETSDDDELTREQTLLPARLPKITPTPTPTPTPSPSPAASGREDEGTAPIFTASTSASYEYGRPLGLSSQSGFGGESGASGASFGVPSPLRRGASGDFLRSCGAESFAMSSEPVGDALGIVEKIAHRCVSSAR